VLFYFAESPFFDATSNNASLAIQALHNENMRHFIETREAFEGRLKTMQGVEFIVAHDPLQEAAAAIAAGGEPAEPSNVWVIRKQNRRRRQGMGDEVLVMATYFIVGDHVYMAPSVLSVVGRRMVRSGLRYAMLLLISFSAALYGDLLVESPFYRRAVAHVLTLSRPHLHASRFQIH
jgi:mediator of RNA polymerase II transcription subunit 6